MMGAVRLLPETVYDFGVPGTPTVVAPRSREVVLTTIAGVGTALTVPLTATFFCVAPVLTFEMLPLMPPTAAEALMRRLIVVVATVPPAGVSETAALNVVPFEEISTPAGAESVIAEVKLLPLTV